MINLWLLLQTLEEARVVLGLQHVGPEYFFIKEISPKKTTILLASKPRATQIDIYFVNGKQDVKHTELPYDEIKKQIEGAKSAKELFNL